MDIASVRKAEAELLLPTYDRYPVMASRGKGVYLYSERGERYLDFLSGIGVNALGYGHPAVTRVMVGLGSFARCLRLDQLHRTLRIAFQHNVELVLPRVCMRRVFLPRLKTI